MEKGIPKNMYKEHILELYKSPKNLGTLKNPTHKHTEYNSLCGDEITFHLIIKNKKIKDIKFSGTGCVVSIVSSSMLSEKLKNMDLVKVEKLTKKDIFNLLKVPVTPARIKCALLPLEVVKTAIKR